MVRRLTAGGRWIRTFRTAARKRRVSEGAPGIAGGSGTGTNDFGGLRRCPGLGASRDPAQPPVLSVASVIERIRRKLPASARPNGDKVSTPVRVEDRRE